MRFYRDGPSIPDELLTARDEGRVVFFCGAGVSLARAGLPSFIGLAKQVIAKLGVQKEHPASALLDNMEQVNAIAGLGSIVSADRIFGWLEQDFRIKSIEQAVAQALQPVEDADLSAHQILLQLATSPEGKT